MSNRFINKFCNTVKSLIFEARKSGRRFVSGTAMYGLFAAAAFAAPTDADKTFGTNGDLPSN